MALMLIPYFSPGHDTMEGVFFESSITTPFHFLTVGEVAVASSNAVRGLRYRGLDFDRGIPHLDVLGVDMYISFTEEAANAARDAGLEVISEPSPWTIFDLPDTQRVEPLTTQPVVWAGEESFLDTALLWYDDIDGLTHTIAEDGPAEWPRVTDIQERFLESAPYDITGAEVTDLEFDDQRISFRTNAVGVPHVVKVSYFPNWAASGAEGPYRLSPSLMVVVPTQQQVTLTFEPTAVETMGRLLTIAGIGVVIWWVVDQRRRRNELQGELAE